VYCHFFSEGCAFAISSFVLEEIDPSIVFGQSLPIAQSRTWLFAFQSPALQSFWRSCRMSFPSDIAAILHIGPSFHCCIPGPSIICSHPSVLYDSIPYAMQEQHSGSSSCRRQPTCSRTHHRPGSVSSAVSGGIQQHASPHIGPPIVFTVNCSLGTSWCSDLEPPNLWPLSF
jgi:hypothetical protein